VETRQLRYFVALAEELHFARAATRVGIEQSPLSKAITEMERGLGVRLFVRTRRCTTLTPIGELLLKDARRILTAVDDAHRTILAAASGRTGRLRLAICDGVAHPRISRLLAQITQDEPDVSVQLTHASHLEQVRALRAGHVDVCLGLRASADPDLLSIPLWNDAAVILLHPNHPLTARRYVDRIPEGTRPLFLLGEWLPGQPNASSADFCTSAQIYEPIEYVASTEMLLTIVSAGYG